MKVEFSLNLWKFSKKYKVSMDFWTKFLKHRELRGAPAPNPLQVHPSRFLHISGKNSRIFKNWKKSQLSLNFSKIGLQIAIFQWIFTKKNWKILRCPGGAPPPGPIPYKYIILSICQNFREKLETFKINWKGKIFIKNWPKIVIFHWFLIKLCGKPPASGGSAPQNPRLFLLILT